MDSNPLPYAKAVSGFLLVLWIGCGIGSVCAAVSNETADIGSLCGILKDKVEYKPLPALGPDFTGSSVEIFGLKGHARLLYASQPRDIELPPGDARLQLAYELGLDDEFQLVICVASPRADGEYAYAGPISSQGGRHPLVVEIFMANADAEPARELVILIGWKIEGAPGTSGTMFEPYVFDASGDAGAMQRVQLRDPALSFGFDGFREGERVTYPFRNVQAFRKRLQELGYR